MSSFVGQQLNVAAKSAVSKRIDTTVRAAAKKATKAPVAKSAGKNKWLASESGFDASKFYGPDRVLFLPSGLLDPSEVPAYLDGSLPGE